MKSGRRCPGSPTETTGAPVKIELWQVPLLVMAVLVAGYFAYVAIAGRWSNLVRLWIKMIALGILAAVGLGIGYQLLQRAELSVLNTLLAILMLAVEGFIAWVAWLQLKQSKTPQGPNNGRHRDRDPAV
jgi:hypothetical protein